MMIVRRGRRGRRGQALVEFALVAPLLLLLILGLMDFARAWNVYQVITDAAREGARTAVVENPTITDEGVRAVIEAALGRASLNLDNATIEITGMNSGRGNPTTVRVEYEYRLGWIGALLALAQGTDQLTLTSEIVMRNE
jgi:Flp pilus assembly protein TadG